MKNLLYLEAREDVFEDYFAVRGEGEDEVSLLATERGGQQEQALGVTQVLGIDPDPDRPHLARWPIDGDREPGGQEQGLERLALTELQAGDGAIAEPYREIGCPAVGLADAAARR